MSLKITKEVKTRGTVFAAAIFFITGGLIVFSESAISRDEKHYVQAEQITVNQTEPEIIKSKSGNTGIDSVRTEGTSIDDDILLGDSSDINYDFSSTKLGVYAGPGAIRGVAAFENWLGKPVTYASDYIDYKGGWVKDFRESKIWLAEPWGRWVSQGDRQLVLGVPLLENSDVGQFSKGVNGAYDTHFKELANQLVANNLGNSIIRLGYEANCDTIGPWQATDNPVGYRRMFSHVAKVMKSVAGASFLFDWTVCTGLQYGNALTSFASFYPGDAVVDIIGIDIYDVKWKDPSATDKERWDYNYTRQMGIRDLVAFARAHGKSLSYPEWGLYAPGDNFAGGGDNPYFIHKMAKLISNTKPFYHAYFNLDWGGGVMSDFKEGQSTFKQIFGS